MEEKIIKIKEELTELVNEYKIEDVSIWIEDNININNINSGKSLRKEVFIEVKM